MKYHWEELTEEEEKDAAMNLALRAQNLRRFAPEDKPDVKKGYEANAAKIENVLTKIGAR